MNGITFGTKHSYNDWGIWLEDTQISPPVPKRYIVSVPARNGVLDLTPELTPIMRFESRQLTFTFRVKAGGWDSLLSTIYGDVHGKTMDVSSDWDAGWHWHGFVTIDNFASDERTGVLVINVDADPFKLSDSVTTVSTTGSGSITCVCDRMELTPTIVTTAAATIDFGDISAAVDAGTHIISDIIFTEGNNTLTIASTGDTTVTYTNGRL